MSLHTFPELPSHIHIGAISDDDNTRIERLYPQLPSSSDKCQTCFGAKTFKFYECRKVAPPYFGVDRPIVTYVCPCQDQFVLQRYLLVHGMGISTIRWWYADSFGLDDNTREVIINYLQQMRANVSRGRGLFLHGTPGNGKTLITSILFRTLLNHGITGQWIAFHDLLDEQADGWRDTDVRRLFNIRVRNAQVLVIDDIGKEYANRPTVVSTVDSILRHRVQHGLVTMISTNMTPTEFAERYHSAIASLMTEAYLDVEVAHTDVRAETQRNTEYEVEQGLARPYTLGGL